MQAPKRISRSNMFKRKNLIKTARKELKREEEIRLGIYVAPKPAAVEVKSQVVAGWNPGFSFRRRRRRRQSRYQRWQRRRFHRSRRSTWRPQPKVCEATLLLKRCAEGVDDLVVPCVARKSGKSGNRKNVSPKNPKFKQRWYTKKSRKINISKSNRKDRKEWKRRGLDIDPYNRAVYVM